MSKLSTKEMHPDDDESGDDSIIGSALIWSLVVICALAAGAGGVWYFLRKPTVVETAGKQDAALPSRFTPMDQIAVPSTPFSDVTQSAGITFKHHNGATGEKLLPETMGAGVAFFDFDKDGDQDLIFVNSTNWPDGKPVSPPPTPELYRNDGNGVFENVTAGSGLETTTFYGMGVACGDIDGDGWTDLFFTAVGGNKLFRNVQGKFQEVANAGGAMGDEKQWTTSAGFFDFDNDHDLDLFVCNYVAWTADNDKAQDFKLIGGGRAYGRPQNFPGTYCSLFQNDGKGAFTDVSKEMGIQIVNPNIATPMAKSLGVIFFDLNADAYLDIVVANDTVQNFVFENQQGKGFKEIGVRARVAFNSAGEARGSMGIDYSYFRNNREIGVAIGNFSTEMMALFVSQDKKPVFTDEALACGVGPETRQELTFGVLFVDLDLDGRLDITSANGHLEDDINKVIKTQTYEQSPKILWNAGMDAAVEFITLPVEKVGTDFHKPMVGRASAAADIDGDGDLDLVITASGRAPRLLRNDQKLGHHWLRVKCKGKTGLTEAIGATVTLETKAGVVQRRFVSPTRSYLAQSELPVTFGLGEEEQIKRLEIRWPNGKTQEVKEIGVDQLIVVEQAE
jgi:hypothetical protein